MKTEESISSKGCRDCGHLLENTARGCPRCAMNVEAERMIERFVWRRLVPGVIIIAVLAGSNNLLSSPILSAKRTPNSTRSRCESLNGSPT